MAPNIESLTPEQLDAMEQAAMAQASAPATSTDLSKIPLEELDALEQQHLSQEATEESKLAPEPFDEREEPGFFSNLVDKLSPGPGNTTGGVSGALMGMIGDKMMEGEGQAPGTPMTGWQANSQDDTSFMNRHPVARKASELVQDAGEAYTTAKTFPFGPIVSTPATIGAGLTIDYGRRNVDQFLNELSNVGDGQGFTSPAPFLDGQHSVDVANRAAMNSTIQGVATKALQSLAGVGIVDKARQNLKQAKDWFGKAVGATGPQTSPIGARPAGDIAEKAFTDGYLLPSAEQTEQAVGKAVGFSNKVHDYRVQGEVGDRITQGAKAIFDSSGGKAATTFKDLEKRILGDDQVEGEIHRLINANLGQGSREQIATSLKQELAGVLDDARTLIPVETKAGPSTVKEAYEALDEARNAIQARIDGLPSESMTATRRDLARQALEIEKEQIEVGTKDLITGKEFPGWRKLKAVYDNPPITLPNLIDFKRGVSKGLSKADYKQGLNPNAPFAKEAIQSVRGVLANEGNALALKYGGREPGTLGEGFVRDNNIYHNLKYFQEYLPGIAKAERENALSSTAKEHFVEAASTVRHPLDAIVATRNQFSKPTNLSDWGKAYDRFARSESLASVVGVKYRIGDTARAVDNLPIIPKFIGLKPVRDLARDVTPMVAPAIAGSISPADAQASEVEGLTNAIAASMLPPEQLQDPAATQQALAQAQQVLQPLNMARTHGTREDVAAEMALLTKEHPEVFAAPRTGIPGEVVVEGKVMFPHPEDGLKYSERVKRSSLKSVAMSKVRSDVHWNGYVSKVIK